jgi:hypothetical protein
MEEIIHLVREPLNYYASQWLFVNTPTTTPPLQNVNAPLMFATSSNPNNGSHKVLGFQLSPGLRVIGFQMSPSSKSKFFLVKLESQLIRGNSTHINAHVKLSVCY